MDELLDDLNEDPKQAGRALPVLTANVDHVVTLRNDVAFRAAYDNAWRVTADGMPVFLYAKLMGVDINERVAGSDVVQRFFSREAHPDFRYFFVASSDATARAIKTLLIRRGVAATSIASVVPPFGFHRDADYSRRLASRIAAHGTTHLFMGVGAPKSEIWVETHKRSLGGCYALCVGAGLDYLAGEKIRAPALVRTIGLEWLWRFGAEPRRLWKRYVSGAFLFAREILSDMRMRHRLD